MHGVVRLFILYVNIPEFFRNRMKSAYEACSKEDELVAGYIRFHNKIMIA